MALSGKDKVEIKASLRLPCISAFSATTSCQPELRRRDIANETSIMLPTSRVKIGQCTDELATCKNVVAIRKL